MRSSPRPTKRKRPEIERARRSRQPPFAHQRRPRPRQIALGAIGEAAHQQIADHQRQHRVAEKLQPLVVGATGRRRLVPPGGVRQRRLGQRPVAKDVPETRLQVGEGIPLFLALFLAVHRTASISPMSDATNICCVKCNSILDKALFQGLEVDLCPKCGGLWLDRGEITRAAKLPETELARLRGLLAGKAGPPPIPTESIAPCPVCPGSLSEVMLGIGSRRLLQPLPGDLPRQGRAASGRRRRPRARSQHESAGDRRRDLRRPLSGRLGRPLGRVDPTAAQHPIVAVVEHGGLPRRHAERRLVEPDQGRAVA